jgi:putative addiction module killer protein
MEEAVGIGRQLARMEQSNFSNVKTVGEGVLEYRINFGPGYRVYFGRDGDALVILLEHDPEKCVAVFRKDHAQSKT